MNKLEKNPIKIIWLTKTTLFPPIIWFLWLLVITLLVFLTFAVPDSIVKVDLTILKPEIFIGFAIPALAFVIAMYSFGREIYSEDDLAKLYNGNKLTYYGFLADYLFSALNWGLLLFYSGLSLLLIIDFPKWLIQSIQILYIAQIMLAIFSTLSIVVKNMSRVTNKVVLKAEEAQ